MEIITINNIGYVRGKDIMEQNHHQFNNKCKNERDFQRNNNITGYIYARKNNNIWTQSDGKSTKLDKVFIEEAYYKNIINPTIIKTLSSCVTFIDDDSDESLDEIGLFKLNDVAKYLDIQHLYDIVTANNDDYILNEDYKYVIVQNKETQPYLTYDGLLRVVYSINNDNTQC